MDAQARQPFEGLRVLDVTHVLAGPYCSYQLAILGADVIKIEPTTSPDCVRGRGPSDELNALGLGINYLAQGSNKRSMAIDLRTADGKTLFLELVETADVLVENYRAGGFESLGFTMDLLHSRNPRLIICSISGFGRDNERAAVNAYDNVIQAASGLMASTIAPTSEPIKIGASVVDYAVGNSAAFAIAAALFQRVATNQGQFIDCSMFETALMLMAPEVTAELCDMPLQQRPKEAGLGTYQTADGLLMLGAFNTRQNKRLWDSLGYPQFAHFTTWPEIWNAADEMRAELSVILQKKSAVEWEQFFHAVGIPAERVRTLKEALMMPHLVSRNFFHKFHPNESEAAVTIPIAPFRFSNCGPAIERRPPQFGEHTDEILRELGKVEHVIDDLRARKIVA